MCGFSKFTYSFFETGLDPADLWASGINSAQPLGSGLKESTQGAFLTKFSDSVPIVGSGGYHNPTN